MRRGPRYLPVAVAALLLGAVWLTLLGCGSAGPAPDPVTVLSGSTAKMKLIKGFHLVYEVHKPANAKPGTGLQIARITADVNADGNMQAVLDVTQSGVPLKLNFVQVGDNQYLQMGAWQKIPVDSSPVGKLTLGASTVNILQQVTQPTYVGRESKAGATCYHLTGSVPADAVRAIATSTTATTPFPVDIWIGVKDSYVYEVDIKGAATADEPQGTSRSIILSKHGVFVNIKAPI